MESSQAPAEVSSLSPARRDGKVVEGKNGRLFLANDSNEVLRQHAGELWLRQDQLRAWQELLERRLSVLGGHGSQYVFVIAPDAHSVYPEDLPEGMVPASRRPVQQLMNHLRDAGSPVPVLYPLAELAAEKFDWPVYPRTGTHWDEFGGFLVYRRLCREITGVPLRAVSRREIAFGEVVLPLDLGMKMTPPRSSPHTTALLLDQNARLLHDNHVENTGSIIVTECHAAPPSTCVLFGDSYSEAFVKFLAESFRRFVFAHSPTIDLELVERERPDLVLSLMAERFLIQVPDDVGAPSMAERESAKRAEGAVREEITFWSGNFPSVWAVERIRALLLAEHRLVDAATVSVLAYAGLRPDELQRLLWQDVGERKIHVRIADASEQALDLGPERRVPLMVPLADDLAAWRHARREATADERVFPGPSGDRWNRGEWVAWHEQVFKPAAEKYGLVDTRPYDLHNTFCSLLIHEGMSPAEVGQQAGYPASTMSEVYEHRFLVARQARPIRAEDRIMAIRSEVRDASQ